MNVESEGGEEDFFSPPEKTLIIGCTGRMGKMLCCQAAKAGLSVSGVDQPLEDGMLEKACKNVSMALFCVPARFFEETVVKLKPHLPSDCILSDITSVKEAPVRQMEKHWQGPVVGTHPLFGPNFKETDSLQVAITAGNNASASHIGQVKAFFKKMGFSVFECTAQEHDLAMAKIQNMNFITNLAYFAVLAGQEELKPFLTPSFERRRKAAAKMLTEDAEMFAGLYEANSHSHETVRQFSKMLNLAASGDIELLSRRAQWWFRDQDGENSLPSQT